MPSPALGVAIAALAIAVGGVATAADQPAAAPSGPYVSSAGVITACVATAAKLARCKRDSSRAECESYREAQADAEFAATLYQPPNPDANEPSTESRESARGAVTRDPAASDRFRKTTSSATTGVLRH